MSVAERAAATGVFLREAFTENLGLKSLSLAFAIGLFLFLYGQRDEQQRTVAVGLTSRPPSEDSARELMTQLPASIHVTLRGPAHVIDRLVQQGIPPITADLRDGERDSIVFNERMFSLPPDTHVTAVDPPSIELEWEDVIARQIPVQASITGQPAEGYVVKGEPEVDPKLIAARGPSSLVEVLQFARLAAFDVSGLSEGVHRRRLALDAAPTRVRYMGPSAATVSVTIARRVTEASFAGRPVEVLGPSIVGVSPRAVDVTVTGPPEVVQALRAEQVVPRANLMKAPGLDLKDLRHGSAELPVTVELSGAEAKVQPPTVTVKW
ncbi:MAG TPA: CdaR family protein [Polyangiaceae bacterium]|nr:CdaR family protein [Polyangiaceae bacterium]